LRELREREREKPKQEKNEPNPPPFRVLRERKKKTFSLFFF